MDDREVVAAIAAGSPAGVAAIYDRYAAILYGYCQWMLDRSAEADQALQDTIVVASGTIADLADVAKLRPWLYSLARHECRRRLRTAKGQHSGPEGDANDLPDVRGDLGQAELLSLIRGILAELPPHEREATELSLRHNLHDDDLAEALGVSWSRAQALTAHARGRLERALGALLIARIGRAGCSELDALLADWDGRLTEQARDLITGHCEQCETCAGRRLGALRPAALSGLMPLAPLPPELRGQVLELCFSTAARAVTYRRRVTRRAGSVWLGRVIMFVRWASLRGIRRPATATVVLTLWIMVVFAASLTTLAFAGSHPTHAVAAGPSIRPPSTSPAAAAITAAAAPAITSLSPSPTVSQPQIVVPPSTEPSSTFVEPSPSRSAKSSKSPSPKPSKSPSSSPSRSTSASPSPSPTG